MKAIEKNGKIVTYKSLPKVWEGIINFKASTEAQLLELGFKDVIIPTLTNYQRLGELYLDVNNDIYTYTIIDFTQKEIDDYDENKLSNDTSSVIEDEHILNGGIMYRKLKSTIRRAKENNLITQKEFDTIYIPLRKALIWLNSGDWDIAKDNIDSITLPKTPNLLDVYNVIKLKIDDYVNNKFN